MQGEQLFVKNKINSLKNMGKVQKKRCSSLISIGCNVIMLRVRKFLICF